MYSCRDNAAKLFGSENPENIIFTLNCTTALNTVIKGILKQGDHAVISSLEHNAVVRPLETLKKNKIEYSVAECVPYDDEQTIENFRKQFKSNTKLVICTHASNVFGIKLPIERIGALCRLNGILFCVDAAQSAGTADINLSDSCIDFSLAPQVTKGFTDRWEQACLLQTAKQLRTVLFREEREVIPQTSISLKFSPISTS